VRCLPSGAALADIEELFYRLYDTSQNILRSEERRAKKRKKKRRLARENNLVETTSNLMRRV